MITYITYIVIGIGVLLTGIAIGADKPVVSDDMNILEGIEGTWGGLTRESDAKMMVWIEKKQWDYLNKRLTIIERVCNQGR